MLLENFYKIIHRKEREDGKREIEIELNPGHALYQGHFPGQPVVPGVCTLQMIKEKCRTNSQPAFAVCTDCFFQIPVCHQPAGNTAAATIYPSGRDGRAPFQVTGRGHL